MAKGKKFNAAEKHFNEKLIRINKEKDEMRLKMQELERINEYLEKRNKSLSESVSNLKEENIILMRASNLSEVELQTFLKKAESINHVCEMIKAMNIGPMSTYMSDMVNVLGMPHPINSKEAEEALENGNKN